MTSYEPVVNLQKLALLYDQHKVDSRPNFIYMTLPGSLLDQFASRQRYRRVELQPDHRNSTAGRHSSPLTRGSLYPLGFSGVDLKVWMQATKLEDDENEVDQEAREAECRPRDGTGLAVVAGEDHGVAREI